MNATNKKRTPSFRFLVCLCHVINKLNNLLIAFVLVNNAYKESNRMYWCLFWAEFDSINPWLDGVWLEMDITPLRINKKIEKQIRRLRQVYLPDPKNGWQDYSIKLTDDKIAEIGEIIFEVSVWCIKTLKTTASKKDSKKNELARKNLMEHLESTYCDKFNKDFKQAIISLKEEQRWDYFFSNNPRLGEMITILKELKEELKELKKT